MNTKFNKNGWGCRWPPPRYSPLFRRSIAIQPSVRSVGRERPPTHENPRRNTAPPAHRGTLARCRSLAPPASLARCRSLAARWWSLSSSTTMSLSSSTTMSSPSAPWRGRRGRRCLIIRQAPSGALCPQRIRRKHFRPPSPRPPCATTHAWRNPPHPRTLAGTSPIERKLFSLQNFSRRRLEGKY